MCIRDRARLSCELDCLQLSPAQRVCRKRLLARLDALEASIPVEAPLPGAAPETSPDACALEAIASKVVELGDLADARALLDE
eukprot:12908577-Alexandrium_andersonii.AAC.1